MADVNQMRDISPGHLVLINNNYVFIDLYDFVSGLCFHSKLCLNLISMLWHSCLQEYLNGFQVKELKRQIEAAKVKVREASEAVTENAKVVMAQLAKKSPRVAIKVSMSAPVILLLGAPIP